jgi:hypothetical protein
VDGIGSGSCSIAALNRSGSIANKYRVTINDSFVFNTLFIENE